VRNLHFGVCPLASLRTAFDKSSRQMNGVGFALFASRFSIYAASAIILCRNAAGETFKQFAQTLRSSGFEVLTCCFRYRPPNVGEQFLGSSKNPLRANPSLAADR